jgi:hypothetical protein
MPKPINPVRLREEYDRDAEGTLAFVEEAVRAGEIWMRDLSLRELFEGLVDEGPAVVRAMDPTRKSGGTWRLREAASAVDLSAFSNITGQIIFAEVKREFELATMLAGMLCCTRTSPFPYGERVPGVGGIGDQAEVVDEGQPYPTVGVNEEYIDFPRPQKRGFIVPVSREAIVFDRTQVVVERCGRGTKWLALNKEKRVLDTVFGVTNTYKRNGTALNTYLTAGAYVNDKTSNALVDWTNVEKAELMFDAIADPNTGEPIAWQGEMTLIVPTALRRTAHRIVHATEIRFNDGASNTTAAYGQNPLQYRANGIAMSSGITILSSPYVKARTGSATKWFYGRPKEAFVYNEVWAIETSQAPAGHPAQFNSDIELQFKASEFGTAGVMEPRYMTRQDA